MSGESPADAEGWKGARRYYAEEHARREARRSEAESRSRRLANVRGLTFVAALATLVLFDFAAGALEGLALAALAVLTITFAIQVVGHRRVRRAEQWEGALAGLAHEGLLRVERRWRELDDVLPAAEREGPEPDPDHPYARDLDLTGTASLVRLLGPTTSERGRTRLREWLLAVGPQEEVLRRQSAVRALAPERALRATFTAHGRLHVPREALEPVEGFLGWAEDEPWFLRRPSLRLLAVVLPLVLAAAVALDVLGRAGPWWLLPAVAQVLLYRRTAAPAARSFGRAEAGAGPARALVPQLRLLEHAETDDPYLSAIRARLGGGGDAAHRHLERVARLLDTAASRRNLVYQTLAPLLLLNVHLGVALDRWRAAHGPRVRDWLEAAGEWEALAALATLAHDHPEWSFPRSSPATGPDAEGATLHTLRLGHPLLRPDRCVRNDVTIGPPGTFLLVTGSNMSGKSTLLRAIGVNAVLAGAGAPVCAEIFTAPPLRVHTCMRVDDSLAAGISLFMAELLRIRGLVDAARSDDPEGRPVLYLIDEMLHGTNTAERRVAARGILRHLLDAGAIGAVSTHDLTLAEVEGLRGAAAPVHFREEVRSGQDGRPRLLFDHRLRPGIATTRNALQLLAAVGLATERGPDPERALEQEPEPDDGGAAGPRD